MQVLAELYPTQNGPFVPGDTDHDGFNEVIAGVNLAGEFNYRILEEQGNNDYVEVFVGPYFNPYASGDFDQDGNAEVFGQAGQQLVVYESASPSSHPSLLSWLSPPLTNVIGFGTIGDTDGDGQTEIIHSINTFSSSRLVIYENTADSAFSQVFFELQSHPQTDGPKLIADLDGDGGAEIAVCGSRGYLRIYESSCNDTWKQTFFDSTGLSHAWGVTGGKDTDGNGKPELFVSGNAQDGTDERRTFVYESNGDDGFVRVASLGFYDGYQGASWNAVTNLDGVGREEFVVFLFPGLFVYRAVAPGQWMLSCIIPTLGDENFFMSFDANRNEREELFWSESGMAPFASTVVLEHTEVSPTDAPREVVSVRSLEVFPNPCHNQSTLLLPRLGRTTVSAVATFDAAGRLVARSAVRADTSTVPWPPVPLSSGVYFVRLEDSARATLAQGRVMVLQ